MQGRLMPIESLLKTLHEMIRLMYASCDVFKVLKGRVPFFFFFLLTHVVPNPFDFHFVEHSFL